jgi:hypothetical protein
VRRHASGSPVLLFTIVRSGLTLPFDPQWYVHWRKAEHFQQQGVDRIPAVAADCGGAVEQSAVARMLMSGAAPHPLIFVTNNAVVIAPPGVQAADMISNITDHAIVHACTFYAFVLPRLSSWSSSRAGAAACPADTVSVLPMHLVLLQLRWSAMLRSSGRSCPHAGSCMNRYANTAATWPKPGHVLVVAENTASCARWWTWVWCGVLCAVCAFRCQLAPQSVVWHAPSDRQQAGHRPQPLHSCTKHNHSYLPTSHAALHVQEISELDRQLNDLADLAGLREPD